MPFNETCLLLCIISYRDWTQNKTVCLQKSYFVLNDSFPISNEVGKTQNIERYQTHIIKFHHSQPNTYKHKTGKNHWLE